MGGWSLDTYIFYDGMGRTVQTRKPYSGDQQIISGMIQYNNRGEVSKTGQPFIQSFSENYYDYQTNDMVNPTEFYYDPVGRVTKTTFPDGSSSTTVYYVDFEIFTDANGKQRKTYFDIYNQVEKIVEYNGEETYETQYQYDLLGNLIKTIDSDIPSNTIQIFYDSLGRKKEMIDPDMGHWTYQYDEAGNLKYQEDNLGQVTTFQYDELARLILKDYSSSSSTDDVKYFYDDYDGVPDTNGNSEGKLTKVLDGSGEIRFYYDELGRVIENIQIIDGVEYKTKTARDLLNKTEFVEYPDGEIVSFSYNEAGLLNSVVGALEGETTIYIEHIEYDHFGKRTRQVNGNGTVTEYEYNYETGLLDKILTNNGETIIQDLDYIFDNVGNITEITDNVQGKSTSYVYDDLYRLTNVNNPDYTRTYSYDSIGNIKSKFDVGNYEYSGVGPHAVTKAGMYDFEYDANGNMTKKSYNDNEKFQELSYDYDNRVTMISNELNNTVDFVYDYTGRRVKKIYSGGLDTTYVNSFYEFKSDGTVTKHIFDGVRRIVSKTSGVGPTWYHTDHLGSTNLLTDNEGNIIQHTEYYPYGETRVSEGEDVTQYKFTGQEFDPETGLYYYGARYYDPVIGRFISADTVVPDPLNPQALNRYAYCLNNPLNYNDPTGHSSEFWDKFKAEILTIGTAIAIAALPGGISLSTVLGATAFGAGTGAISAVAAGGDIWSGALLGAATGAVAGSAVGALARWSSWGGFAAVYRETGEITAAACKSVGMIEGAIYGAAHGVATAYKGGKGDLKDMLAGAGIGFVLGGIQGRILGNYKYKALYEQDYKRYISLRTDEMDKVTAESLAGANPSKFPKPVFDTDFHRYEQAVEELHNMNTPSSNYIYRSNTPLGVAKNAGINMAKNVVQLTKNAPENVRSVPFDFGKLIFQTLETTPSSVVPGLLYNYEIFMYHFKEIAHKHEWTF